LIRSSTEFFPLVCLYLFNGWHSGVAVLTPENRGLKMSEPRLALTGSGFYAAFYGYETQPHKPKYQTVFTLEFDCLDVDWQCHLGGNGT
jgi:hypothetical protein